ncbi:MAG: FAD-binding oxidoreductase [Actinobacteria bacterium]|nr:FAD-binding oxidoreductase [Actinomycetota bacterium]MBO0789092.1 FAD-binding oxidoreductase [Actinomycetota bacterium]MBO0816992.1 FAD-binding oxidoreductase [Actinomycetota bacterium]
MTLTTSLRDRFTGRVVAPGDPDYEDARHVHNFMIDKNPAVIAYCASTQDVQAVVDHARADGRHLAVRGGAHSVPGYGTADDAIVADLSGLDRVRVDPARRTARVGGGATWGTMNTATAAHGLATTGGIISTTGVGGLTLGGGIGYLARAHGLSCDNLLSAEVVLADGSIVTASETEHPDLFWALRGGGGNFGVVTEFEFRLHPVTDIYGGPMFFEREAAGDIFRLYREFIAGAPREYGGFPAWQIAPPLPFVPEDRVGEPFLALVSCWTGDPAEGERILQRFRDIAAPVAEHVGPMPYPALNSAFDALVPRGLQHYWKAVFVGELTDDAIDAHLVHGPRVPAVNSTMHLYPVNGACHDVPADATAWGHRDASYACVIAGMWPDPADNEANTRWVRDYYAALAPHSQPGGYVNFASADDQQRVRENFGPGYDRLAGIKRRYDPDNFFHLNQNIAPATQ